jgi:hypothetical protein
MDPRSFVPGSFVVRAAAVLRGGPYIAVSLAAQLVVI